MPIAPIVLQRRFTEVGRIRLGAKKTSQNGKEYPAKLENFRLTSRDKDRLDAAAALYGGTVRKWDKEWELYTDADIIPIVVVPGQALSQSFELWGQKTLRGGKKSAVICLRRCDGITEALSGGGCLCEGEEEFACKPTTRLSVMLTEVPGLGVWRLESHGWNAATELAGTVQLLEALVATGRPVRARLRLDKREQKTETETRQFVVPVIDIDHTIGQVLDSIGIGPGPAIEIGPTGEIEPRNGMTPVPALPAAERPSVAEQVAAAAELERPKRSNAAEPIRRTGIAPRTVAQVSGSSVEPLEGAAGAGPASEGGGEEPATNGNSPPSNDDQAALPLTSRVAMWIKAIEPEGLDTKHSDDWRHAWIHAFSSGAHQSAKSVKPGDIDNLQECVRGFRDGELTLGVDGDGFWLDRFVLKPTPEEQERAGSIEEPSADDFESMTVKQLAGLCREREIVPRGDRGALVKLLRGA